MVRNQPSHLAGAGDPRHVTQVLRAAGWTYERDRDGNETAILLDGTLSLPRRHIARDERSLVTAEASVDYGGDPRERIWRADLDESTPTHLLAAFVKTVTSTKLTSQRHVQPPARPDDTAQLPHPAVRPPSRSRPPKQPSAAEPSPGRLLPGAATSRHGFPD